MRSPGKTFSYKFQQNSVSERTASQQGLSELHILSLLSEYASQSKSVSFSVVRFEVVVVEIVGRGVPAATGAGVALAVGIVVVGAAVGGAVDPGR
jgi:hypothetical protein